jgi:hypothetical protein
LCRWTNGDAVLPLLGAGAITPDACLLEIEIAAVPGYPLRSVEAGRVERAVA